MMRRRHDAIRPLLTGVVAFAATLTQAAESLPGSDTPADAAWRTVFESQTGSSPRFVNRLALSSSAYLRQHADNPIDWHPWTEKVLETAAQEERLLFVSIGYASCHWCHVMERESFSRVDVARVLNRHFTAVKIDREARPDLDAGLSWAAESITGESGWPVTLVLLPDQSPVFAAHYLPRGQMLTVLGRLSETWADHPETLRTRARAMASMLHMESGRSLSPDTPEPAELVRQAVERLESAVDKEHGGFGSGEKFPDATRIQFLLDRFKVTGEDYLSQLVSRQLDAIMNGGLSDPVFGGVFRYTTDAAMTRPHFEKMLYNQAQVIRLFSGAANWLERDDYRRYARSVYAFVQDTLRRPDGRYDAAVDAEHGEREGAYYLWRSDAFDVLPEGVTAIPFDADQVLLIGWTDDEEWRARLKARREGTPRVVGNPVTAWNAWMIVAQLALGETAAAVATAEAVWNGAWSEDRLERLDGQEGFLDDYAELSLAYWRLFAETFDPLWRDRARRLDEALLARFTDGEEFHYAPDKAAPGVPGFLTRDRETRSPMSAALSVFAHHGDDSRFRRVYGPALSRAWIEAEPAPDSFTGLLGLVEPPPRRWRIFAGGHGAARLEPGRHAGEGAIAFDLEPPWHVNAADTPDEFLVPTTLSVAQRTGNIDYPESEPLDAAFSDTPIPVYGGRFTIRFGFDAPASTMRLVLRTQACSDRLCLLPEVHEFPLFYTEGVKASRPQN